MGRWVVGLHPTPSGLQRIFVGQGEGAKAELPLGLAARGKAKLMLQPSGEKPAVRIASRANSGGRGAGDVKGWWKANHAEIWCWSLFLWDAEGEFCNLVRLKTSP